MTTHRTRPHARLAAAATAGLLLAGLPGFGSAGAATASPTAATGPSPVAGERSSALSTGGPSADEPQPVAAPDDVPVTFIAGLRRPEAAARRALRRASDPQSSRYRGFRSRAFVRGEYGADVATVRTLRRSAARSGLSVRLDDTGVFAYIDGTAKQFGDWLGKPVMMEAGPAAPGLVTVLFATEAAPPKDAAGVVREWFPYDADTVSDPQALRSAAKRPPLNLDGVNLGTSNSCLTGTDADRFVMSFDQLRTAYGIDRLPAGSDVGPATRAVILSQGDGFSDSALAASAACFGRGGVSFQRVPIDLPGPLPEWQGEADLDTQVMQAVLPPGSVVSVIESSEADPRRFLSWATAFALPRRPDVVSVSYAGCEPEIATKEALVRSIVGLTDAVLVRLGLVGTSAFGAAGDSGSSGCTDQDTGRGRKKPAVSYPTSSRFITAVGGSRLVLTPRNARANEVAWNDTDLLGGTAGIGGGGGGTSILFDAPWWQRRSMTGTTRRSVPDLTAHASAGPGWPVFVAEPSVLGGSVPLAVGNLTPVSGTSAASPFVASAFGLLAASQRLSGRPPLGLVAPALYDLADTADTADGALFDIVEGNNDVYQQGCCQAAPGYDQATGLGAPDFATLARALPRPGRS